MHLIEPRTIYAHLVATNTSFDFTLNNIPFEPDYMVIKQLSFYQSASVNGVILMRSNLTNKYLPMLSIDGFINRTYPVEMTFPLKKTIDGSYTFDFLAFDTNGWKSIQVPAGQTWDIAFSVEFIKEQSL